MFIIAVLIELAKRLVAMLPERRPLTKVQKAKCLALGMRYFENGVKIVVGVFAVLWIMFIIVVKHLLKIIWEFK